MKNQQDNERSKKQSGQGGRSTQDESGDMSVREAGQKGGQRVRELVEEGKESEGDRSGKR